MLCSATKQLFCRFPREIALYRNTVNNIKQFRNYISIKSGMEDLYTSVYGNNFLIDKIFLDFDFGPDVLGDAQKVYSTCIDKGLFKQIIPVASGNECRIHLYPILKPKIHGTQAKIRLLRATYQIIEQTFGKFRQEMVSLPNGKDVQVYRNASRIIGIDPSPVADIRRLCRIPQTLRPPKNVNFCTYLDPDKFLDMTELDIINHIKEPHTYPTKINFRTAPNLEDFEYEFETPPKFNDFKPVKANINVSSYTNDKYLSGILRPCLCRHISSMHPTDYIRFVTTMDLLYVGLSVDNIVSVYSGLGWEDFDLHKTRKKITWIKNKMKTHPEIYHTVKCSTLRLHGIPNFCCEAVPIIKKKHKPIKKVKK